MGAQGLRFAMLLPRGSLCPSSPEGSYAYHSDPWATAGKFKVTTNPLS